MRCDGNAEIHPKETVYYADEYTDRFSMNESRMPI